MGFGRLNNAKWLKRIVLLSSVLSIFIVYSILQNETNQMVELHDEHESVQKLNDIKIIFSPNLPTYSEPWYGKPFKHFNCAVDQCRFTRNAQDRSNADLVIFYERYAHSSSYIRPRNQLYAIFYNESPFHTDPVFYPDIFNWTITYRSDSNITSAYVKWMYFNPDVKQKEQHRNYATNKTKMVAWFVSNCNDKNGRLKYAKELQKYVGVLHDPLRFARGKLLPKNKVDIYGKCGNMTCSRDNDNQCYGMLDKDYKFYLSFENSNCKDYITEKLHNVLHRNVLPIVMGASPEDYAKYAPQRSYIHVDDFESPKKLAEYLHELNGNDERYNEYFRWKGTGEFSSYNHLCDACAMLHNNEIMSTRKWYKNVNEWWHGPGICTTKSWRQTF